MYLHFTVFLSSRMKLNFYFQFFSKMSVKLMEKKTADFIILQASWYMCLFIRGSLWRCSRGLSTAHNMSLFRTASTGRLYYSTLSTFPFSKRNTPIDFTRFHLLRIQLLKLSLPQKSVQSFPTFLIILHFLIIVFASGNNFNWKTPHM